MAKRLLRQFLAGFQSFQARNQFVARTQNTGLTLSESHLLVELDTDSPRSPSELAASLMVTRPTISRTIASLLRSKLVRVESGGEDKRYRRIFVTVSGKRQLEALDAGANRRLEEFTASLSVQEVETLKELLTRVADGLGVKDSSVRSSDHVLRRAIRRLSRAFGLLGDSVFGVGGLSSLEWHILTRVSAANGYDRSVLLAKELSIPKNTLSQVLSRLEKRHLVSRNRHESGDRRRAETRITPQGASVLDTIVDVAVEKLARATKRFATKELEELVRLTGVLGGVAPKITSILIQPKIELRRFTDSAELAEARGFAVRALARNPGLQSIPHEIVQPGSIVVGMFIDDVLEGVIEYDPRRRAIDRTYASAEWMAVIKRVSPRARDLSGVS